MRCRGESCNQQGSKKGCKGILARELNTPQQSRNTTQLTGPEKRYIATWRPNRDSFSLAGGLACKVVAAVAGVCRHDCEATCTDNTLHLARRRCKPLNVWGPAASTTQHTARKTRLRLLLLAAAAAALAAQQ
jgi:hypothetical protein